MQTRVARADQGESTVTPTSQNKLTVVYIAGAGRSGSTILDRVLGAFDASESFNELYRVYEDGFAGTSRCACGKQIDACDFWQSVMSSVAGLRTHIEDCAMDSRKFDRSRMFLSLYNDLLSAQNRSRLARYRDRLCELLHAMASQAEIDTIVDSSKLPTRALVLAGIDSLDVRVIHLLREPRAVANAWLKERYDPGRESSMNRYGAYRTMAFWSGRQLMSEQLENRVPYMQVRYEDFASQPRKTLEDIARFVPGWEFRAVPVSEIGDVDLGPLHSISGNPDRFKTGVTRIALDEAWRTSPFLPTLNRAAGLIRPISRRYGY